MAYYRYRWVAAPTEALLKRAEICSTREAAIEAARQEHGDVDLQVLRVEIIAPEYYAPDAGHVIEYIFEQLSALIEDLADEDLWIDHDMAEDSWREMDEFMEAWVKKYWILDREAWISEEKPELVPANEDDDCDRSP